jgi:hypothetical protein
MSLSTAIAQFLQEFTVFESQYVGMALRSLTADGPLLDQAQRRLDLYARLTLVKRMAMARDVDMASLASLDRVIKRSLGLQEKYDELTRNSVAAARDARAAATSSPKSAQPLGGKQLVWLPTVKEVVDCRDETADLQRVLQNLAQRFQSRSASTISPVTGDNRVHNSIFSQAAP